MMIPSYLTQGKIHLPGPALCSPCHYLSFCLMHVSLYVNSNQSIFMWLQTLEEQQQQQQPNKQQQQKQTGGSAFSLMYLGARKDW